MKKGVFYILILFTIARFSTSCCPSEKYYRINDKDKLTFKEGDMFVYKSNLGNYDTLIVERITDTLKYQANSEGFCDTKLYGEEIHYFLNNLNNPFEKDKRPYFKIEYISYEDEIHFQFFSCIPYDPDRKAHLFYPGIYYLEDSIYYNVNYYNCYNCTDNKYCNRYAYNRTYGIIFFAYPDGEEFSLLKYVSAK